MAFDRKVFATDWFTKRDWKKYESYWMIVDDEKIGCCAFEHNVDFKEDLAKDNPPRLGSLYITTTGILPAGQGRGLGNLMKCWQISYARFHGFTRIVTNCRASNTRIITLNEKFGFSVIRTTPEYYEQPAGSVVVMERNLSPRWDMEVKRVRSSEFVQCHSLECCEFFRIRILESIPEEKESDPLPLPKDTFPLRVVCPKCERGYVYSETEVQLRPPQMRDQMLELDRAYLIATMQCAKEGCGVLTRWHMQVDLTKPGFDARTFARAIRPELTCLNGHPLHDASQIWFQLVSGEPNGRIEELD